MVLICFFSIMFHLYHGSNSLVASRVRRTASLWSFSRFCCARRILPGGRIWYCCICRLIFACAACMICCNWRLSLPTFLRISSPITIWLISIAPTAQKIPQPVPRSRCVIAPITAPTIKDMIMLYTL